MSYSAESPSSRSTGLSTPRGEWVIAGRASLLELARRFCEWPALVWGRRDLLYCSVQRDLQARFRGTFLGFAWVLALPLLQFAIYAFIFTQLLGVKLGPGAAEAPGAMGVYMFTGTLVWSGFADALQRSTSCVVDHRHLVQKVRFPAQLLPLQVGLSSLVTFVAGICAFVAFTLASDVWGVPGPRLLMWAPLLLFLQFLLTAGMGLMLAALHVRLRDTLPLVGVVLTIWMFVTPIFWVPSPEVLPGIEPWLGLVESNPVHHLVYAWRDLLMSKEPRVVFSGDFSHSLSVVACWGLGLFMLGSWAFFRVDRHLADEI
jgi:lipopolysaccharide transport system permease protein